MGDVEPDQGFFSLLRWRLDSTRDEAKNIAVVLVNRDGAFGGVKAAPLSQISTRLRDQGIMDAVVAGLERQFRAVRKPDLGALSEWHQSLHHSLYLTDPRPTAVPDPELALGALYRAYVAPRGGGGNVHAKGRVLDGVVTKLRKRGFEVQRGACVDDFLFDAVVGEGSDARAIEVLSFATGVKTWTPVEHDAGHFLLACEETSLAGLAVIQPPPSESSPAATDAHSRVLRWMARRRTPTTTPAQVVDTLAGVQTLRFET